jgi:hypothetical protein
VLLLPLVAVVVVPACACAGDAAGVEHGELYWWSAWKCCEIGHIHALLMLGV